MKVTLRGGAVVFAAVIVSATLFSLVEVWIILFLYGVKHIFGERVARPFFKINNIYHEFLQSSYYCYVAILLQFGLNTRLAYTIADPAGQAHLDATYAMPADEADAATSSSSPSSRRLWPNLAKILTPPSTPGKSKIILMNHHCRLDWLYMFLFFCRAQAVAKKIRFVIKRDLSDAPFIGWSMEMFRYLFLTRSWANDEAYLKDMVRYFAETGESQVIFIFPEGTDLSPSNREKSQAYAAKEGLPQYHHVLNPRTTGLVAIKNMLGGLQDVEEIVDLTMGYTYHAPGERPTEPSLLSGHHARKVHLLINIYKTSSTSPSPAAQIAPIGDDAAFTAWIHERFSEKEQLLSRFWANNPVGFDPADVKQVLGPSCGVCSYDEDVERAQLPCTASRIAQRYFRQCGVYGMILSPLFWASSFVYMTFFMALWKSVLLIAVVLVSFRALRLRCGGVQRMVYVTKVAEEETLLYRLRQWIENRQKGHKKD